MPSNRGEPVEVWLRDGRPAGFVWRGRMYTVIFVLDRRFTPHRDSGCAKADSAAPAAAGQRGERECWLVEATPVRAVPPAVYELCHDPAADRWTLTRS